MLKTLSEMDKIKQIEDKVGAKVNPNPNPKINRIKKGKEEIRCYDTNPQVEISQTELSKNIECFL